jgi:F420-dependent oxidoreductase-like protein
MAQQALTTQAASGGRLCLGIGLSHQVVIESMWGLDFAKPVRHMKEYLSILLPLVRGEAAAFTGETLSANGALDVHGSSPFPVVVAALGTQMLQLTGRVADGTYTWCVGPDTLASHIIPTISAAAEAAERPTPRIIAGLPVCVTDDPAAVQAQVAKEMVMYGYLPSYRAMMDREGVAGPADLAIVGTASEVTDRLGHLAEIGVTDFAAVEAGTNPDEIANTRAALRSLL